MTRWQRRMQPRRLAGLAAAVIGVGLMIASARLAGGTAGISLLARLPAGVDWFLLAGTAILLCGGVLVQTTWTRSA
jgi:hypothetical protein